MDNTFDEIHKGNGNPFTDAFNDFEFEKIENDPSSEFPEHLATGTCEHCKKELGSWCINPYTQDIDGIEDWEFICNECYNQLVADI